jgi:predicted O-methyltransferase YrrM
MTTLTTAPLTTLLPQLFADAEATQAALHREIGALSPDAQKAFMDGARTDYRGFYGRARDAHLAVSPATARLLYMLARASRARAIVEFGMSFGISTIHLAAALRDNGGGRLITTEFEPSKVARAGENLAAAGLADLVEVRAGDALDTLSRDLPDEIDLVLLDGAKVLYPRVLALVEPRLRVGAIIVADNADASPEYLARVRSTESGYLSVPFGGDVELSTRIAAASVTR